MNKPTLILNVSGKSLSLPVTKALWAVYRIASYPLTVTAGYYFFGLDGAIFTTILLILTFRGQL